MKSFTERIVPSEAGFMEFNLVGTLGYQEWWGFFTELGIKGRLFNGYLMQSGTGTVKISTTPVQIHIFPHAMYLSPPFEKEEYYVQLPRDSLSQSTVYFRVPDFKCDTTLEGHKPKREDVYAIDIGYEVGETSEGKILTLVYEATVPTERGEYHIRKFEV